MYTTQFYLSKYLQECLHGERVIISTRIEPTSLGNVKH